MPSQAGSIQVMVADGDNGVEVIRGHGATMSRHWLPIGKQLAITAGGV
jgi:hypothetical protein